MWFRLMLLAFLTNGLCVFGHNILAKNGWTAKYLPIYLVFWYAAGAALVLALYMRQPRRPTFNELVLGSMLGLLSLCGQTSLGNCLAFGVDGAIAFPIAYAGGLFVVVLAGVLFFRERLGVAGILGIILGLSALVLLGLADAQADKKADPAQPEKTVAADVQNPS